MQEEKFTLSLPVAIVLGALVIAGAILFGSGKPLLPSEAAVGDGRINVRLASADDHIVGSPDAPVVIIEYADFECPFCSLIHPTLERIVGESDGKVAWVYRHFPLTSIHQQAFPAALASECIAAQLGNDVFWAFARALFADQKNLSAEFFASVAQGLGADTEPFAACVSEGRYTERVREDSDEAVTNGGTGTPYTIVMGKKGLPVPFSGALPYDDIMSVVRAVQNNR